MKSLLAASLVSTSLLLSACTGTPKHSNVLIFGTNTKFALDVSQDMTSGVGVTLGYKREEAVWMPLLPNPDDKVGLSCPNSDPDCWKYTGNDHTDRDTYSVLASFGSKSSVGAGGQQPNAQVQGEIAQYFSTGLAARALAARGGAGLVNTQAANLSPEQEARATQIADRWARDRRTVMDAVKDGANPASVDAARMKALLGKATGANRISENARARLEAASRMSQVERALVIHDRDATILAELAQ